MGNSGWTADPNTIIIPANAGPNDPRIVITSEPPASIGYPLDAAILFYWNATDYYYVGISATGFGGEFLTGFVSDTVGLTDTLEALWFDSSTLRSGSYRYVADYNTLDAVYETIENGNYEILADGTYLRNAAEYKLNGILPTIGASDDESQQTQDIELTVTPVGGITTTETVVHTLNGVNPYNGTTSFQSNRRYEIRFCGRIQSTVAADRVQLQIKRNTTGGTTLRNCGQLVIPAAGIPVPVDVGCLFEGLQSIPDNIVLCAVRMTGTGTVAYTPAYAWARDLVSDQMT